MDKRSKTDRRAAARLAVAKRSLGPVMLWLYDDKEWAMRQAVAIRCPETDLGLFQQDPSVRAAAQGRQANTE